MDIFWNVVIAAGVVAVLLLVLRFFMERSPIEADDDEYNGW